jgi:hypothetical protein
MQSISDEWQLINKATGEIKDIITFDGGKRERWEKVYAKGLADLLEISGDERTQVIAYLIKMKDYENRIMETVRSTAEATGVSASTVNRTFQLLQDKNFLHKVRNGLWRFSPHVMVNGKGTLGAAVFRQWDMETQHE